ncbi:hypothetical protein V5268_004658 [Escherichia coli]|uniref:hypothetical protein n=1 Tax=Escherichia coli TaxID=562 RepID=UPI000A19EADA|nr:hypothetical protein [Escherichia coli]MBC6573238.1 hypothetical protein [Escherichia coli]
MPVLIKAGSLTGVPALQGVLPTIFIATKQMALHVMDRDNRITVENYPYIRTPRYFIHPLCQGGFQGVFRMASEPRKTASDA